MKRLMNLVEELRGLCENKALIAKAEKGDISVLKDPNVSKFQDEDGITPLHYLAGAGKVAVLKHPDVSKVKDDLGNTPLHFLADTGKKEVLKHRDAYKVKNQFGKTPADFYDSVSEA